MSSRTKRRLNETSDSTFASPEKSFRPNSFSTNKKISITKKVPDLIDETQDVSIIQINEAQCGSKDLKSRTQSSISITPVNNTFIANGVNLAGLSLPVQHMNQQNLQLMSNLGQVITMPQMQQQPQFQTIVQPNNIQPNIQSHIQSQMQQSGLVIPPGFQGTILFQPTIHMHTKKSSMDFANCTKYRKIIQKPKK